MKSGVSNLRDMVGNSGRDDGTPTLLAMEAPEIPSEGSNLDGKAFANSVRSCSIYFSEPALLYYPAFKKTCRDE